MTGCRSEVTYGAQESTIYSICYFRKMAPLFCFVSDREDELSILFGLQLTKEALWNECGVIMNPANFMVL